MRILYVLNGSNLSTAGGMEYHLMDITNALQAKGVQTAVAVRKGTYLRTHLLKDRPHVYPLSWTGLVKPIAFFQIARALLDFSPDIVSINRERDIKRIYYIIKFMGPLFKTRPKIVAIFQNIGWRSSFHLDKLDGLIFLNEYTKKDYISWNRSAESKSEVIYYGIPLPDIYFTERENPQRTRRFFKNVGFPLIGMVGEFRKNQSELIDVAYHLKKKCPRFTIAFIGRGSDEQINPLKSKISKLGLTEHFIFTGQVERKHIPNVFYDLDISVTTNREEAFGLVFIESLASCAPLVAYNSGGPVEILEKGGGILVHGGAENMAGQLAVLISNHNLRISLGRKGRDVVEKYFSINTMGDRHFQFYQKLLS